MKLLDQAKRMAQRGRLNEELKNVTQDEVKALTKEDLEALHDIMVAPHVGLALVALQKTGFFDYLIPEIKESIELKSSKQFKEIWPHTIRVIHQTPPKLSLRWAALFHDLGKAQSFVVRGGKVTFYNHEKLSAKIFDRFARRAKIFSRGQRGCIHFLVSNLGYVESYENNWTDSAVRRFGKEAGIFLDDLLTLSSADITTANPKKKDKILRRIEVLRTRICKIQEADAKVPPLPKGLGYEIIKSFGLSPGPYVGTIMKELESKIEGGELNAHENFEYYIKHLKDSNALENQV